MTILQLDNVSKVFYSKTADTVAVENLSFKVEEGEFVAVIGPSGCGKTTILSLISKLIQPTSGTVQVNTTNQVGYMFQKDHLFEWRKIRDNVTLGLEIQHKLNPDNLAYVNELLTKYGLADFAGHYPSQISGGMRQRTALIRTLATNPDLLLLDEPFSALDFQTRLDVCNDVYQVIRNEHKTALLVTHDINEAISMADRVLVLSARPAHVVYEHETQFDKTLTPLMRRQQDSFNKQFDVLYRALKDGET